MSDLLNKTASDNMTKAELLEYIKAQQAAKEELEAKVEELEKAEDDIPEPAIRDYLNERVPFYAFKDDNKYKDDIVVGINGKNFIIQRGKHVMIPRYVKMLIDNSLAQEAIAADVIAGFQTQHERRARELNL